MDTELIARAVRRLAIEVLFGCVAVTMGIMAWGGAIVAHERIVNGDTGDAIIIAAIAALQLVGLIWLIRERG